MVLCSAMGLGRFGLPDIDSQGNTVLSLECYSSLQNAWSPERTEIWENSLCLLNKLRELFAVSLLLTDCLIISCMYLV